MAKPRAKDISCGFCEKEFYPKNSAVKYCSHKCANLGNPRGVAVWGKKPGTSYERNGEGIKARLKELRKDPEYQRKERARKAARKAHPDPKPCEKCGNAKADRHHDDYNKPTEIIWLCRKCHINHHVIEHGTWGQGIQELNKKGSSGG